MGKKVYLIHGWGGHPEGAFKPWLKKELEARGYTVVVPALPDTEHPRIENWIPFLRQVIANLDEETILLGHSLGCKAILLFLQALLPEVRVGKVILVAGAIGTVTNLNDEETLIYKPWAEVSIDFDKVRSHANEIVAFFSDNDKWIPLSNEPMIREKLGAKTIIEHAMGHYSDEDGVREVPTILAEIVQ